MVPRGFCPSSKGSEVKLFYETFFGPRIHLKPHFSFASEKNNFKTIIDSDNDDTGNGVLKIMQKPSREVKMVGIETSNGIYVVKMDNGE